jgi:hypothetical protein
VINKFNIADHKHLKVRYTLDYPLSDPLKVQIQEFVLDVVTREKKSWSPSEWDIEIEKIQLSNLTIGEWLEAQNA